MARPRKIEPDQILAAIQGDKTVREIATEAKVGTSTVYQAIKRYGLPKARHVSPPRVAPWCPPHHWPTYMALTGKRLTKEERRAIVEQDIARERRA
jgi:hypothetical protein